MKLQTGRVEFKIEFDNGDIESIFFNPNDKGLRERVKNFNESVQQKIKNIDFKKYQEKINNDAKIDFENLDEIFDMSSEDLEKITEKLEAIIDIDEEYNKAIKEELDIVFNSNISDVVFKYCQPFDVVIFNDERGNERRETFIMQFMRWLMLEIQKYSLDNKDAINKHLAKYNK